PANAADAESLIALDSFASRDASRARHIQEWIARGECFVAEEAGEPLGYAVLNDRFFHRPHLEMLMVSTKHRGKGVGRALLQHLIARGAAEKFFATTNLSNHAMQRLLASEQFRLCGVISELDP